MRWGQSKWKEIKHGVPVPVLHEQNETDNGILAQITVVCGHWDSGVTATRIQDTVWNDGTDSWENLLVFVSSHLLEKFSNCCDFGLLHLCDLDKHHCESNQSTLPNEVNLVVAERCKDSQSILATSACTADTKRKSRTIS